ncbi:Aconitate hydratase [Salipiger mucosus DSM 16094]|uniref:Aconitate hydratase n=1 Tax=Salipiger mucosus DSM 16094 TaxID=1123237 RepID=S9RDG2_9RHOB|nr:Aconitate hydratase [Salipiger mucosus DSM 16094]
MDRHVIANMGTEMGATTTVFPSDEAVRRFLEARGRGEAFTPLSADPGCDYDLHDTVDLSTLEPPIATPSSPGNVVPVTEIAGKPCWQSDIGSSANPGYRDFAMVADIVAGRQIAEDASLDINPSSRQVLETLTFADPADRKKIGRGDTIRIRDLRTRMSERPEVRAEVGPRTLTLRHDLSPLQLDILMAGGVINWIRDRDKASAAAPSRRGATGNTATEDLVFAFNEGGLDTGIDMDRLLAVGDRIAALPGGVVGSHLRNVPRDRAA